MRAFIIAGMLFLALTGPAAADPFFTPLFVSLGVTGAIKIGATVITYASILSGVATALVTSSVGPLVQIKRAAR